jgi:hypothetical protein
VSGKRAALAGALLALAAGGGIAIGALAFAHHETRREVEKSTKTIVVTTGGAAVPSRRAPLPTMLSGAFRPHEVPLQETVPADAHVLDARYIAPSRGFRPEIVVTWRRDWRNDPFPEFGLMVWERAPGNVADWHRAYAWAVETSKNTEVQRIAVSLGDFTRDGHDDILLTEDLDGSAGNADYRAIALLPSSGTELWSRRLSADQGSVELAGGAIKVSAGFDPDGDTIHCCYRKVRIRWLRWTGEQIAVVRELERKNKRRWPPG